MENEQLWGKILQFGWENAVNYIKQIERNFWETVILCFWLAQWFICIHRCGSRTQCSNRICIFSSSWRKKTFLVQLQCTWDSLISFVTLAISTKTVFIRGRTKESKYFFVHEFNDWHVMRTGGTTIDESSYRMDVQRKKSGNKKRDMFMYGVSQ